jgi:hypothetical protein
MPSLVGLFGDGVRNAAFSQVRAEVAGAVSLVCDDLVGPAPRSVQAGAGNTDPFQQRTCADTVVALAGRHQDRQRAALAVAGKVNFGGQSASGSTEGVIVRFVLLLPPPFRPVAAVCWWARARTMVESIRTSQSMSPAASAWA